MLNYQLFVESQWLLECPLAYDRGRLLFSGSATAVRVLQILVPPMALGNVNLVLDTSEPVPLLQVRKISFVEHWINAIGYLIHTGWEYGDNLC